MVKCDKVHICMYRGDTEEIDVYIKNVTDIDLIEPIDISGTDLWFTAKDYYADDDTDAIISKDTVSGIVIINGPNGHARITLDPLDTIGFTDKRKLRFDVQWSPDGLKMHTVLRGHLEVLFDVTQSTTI